MLLKWWFVSLLFLGVLALGKSQSSACGYQTRDLHGTIKSPTNGFERVYGSFSCIWNITLPAEYQIYLEITRFYVDGNRGNCSSISLVIHGVAADNDTEVSHKICGSQDYLRKMTLKNHVNMKYYHSGNGQMSYFTVEYRAKRVITERVVTWISNNIEILLGRKESLPRALPALRLFDEGYFSEGNITGYKFKTQYLLKLSADLLRNSTQTLSVADLSHHVLALLSICYNPRSFHGIDLVRTLRNAIDTHVAVAKPFDMLTLCSSGENLTSGDIKKLNTVLSTGKPDVYMIDFHAIAVMALLCAKQRNMDLDVGVSLQQAVDSLTMYEKSDGSFGSFRSTVLISQALSAAGDLEMKWNRTAALYFIESKNHSDGSFGNVDDLYTVLPVLTGKTLLDINAEKCDFSPEGVSPLDEVKDKMNDPISLTYQLWIGDEAEVVHTIALKFPNGTKFFDAMRLAAENDDKFRLKWTFMRDDMYVYQIGDYINDPTGGKYWNLYTFGADNEPVLFKKHLEDYIPSDNDTAVMWYRRVHLAELS